MPQVLEVENACFEFPWNEEDFIRCLRQRNCMGKVVESDDRIVGCMIYQLFKNRIELINFAVHPSYQAKGAGRCMVEKLVGKLSRERRSRILVAVRESNLGAQMFFSSVGFLATEVIPSGYYDDTDEEAYLFEYEYIPTEDEILEAAGISSIEQ